MPRALPVFAACVALLGSGAAHAQSAGRVEMDVLEADETPEQAMKRLEDAARRAQGERAGRAAAPALSPFIPEDTLGARGLLAPVAVTAPELPEEPTGSPLPGLGDLDLLGGHDKGGGKGHDKDDDDHGKGKDDDKG